MNVVRGGEPLLVVLLLVAGPSATGAQSGEDWKTFAEIYAEVEALVEGGELEEAHGQLLEAVAELEPPRLTAAGMLIRAAQIARSLGRFDQTVSELRQARSLLDDSDDSGPYARHVSAAFARLYMDYGLLDLADARLTELEQALPPEEPVPEPRLRRDRLLANFLRAGLLLMQEDYDGLEAHVASSLEWRGYEGFPGEAARLKAVLGVGLVQVAGRKPEVAERAAEVLDAALAEKALGAPDRVQPLLARVELALRAGDFNAARRDLAAAGNAMGPAEVRSSSNMFPTYTVLRVRLLRATGADEEVLTRSRDELQVVFRRQLEGWRARERRPGGYGYQQFLDGRALLSEWIDLRLELEGDQALPSIFEALLDLQEAGTLVRGLGGVDTTLDRVRADVLEGRDHLILVYLPAVERSHLFALTAEGLEHHPLAPRDEIEEARRDLVRSLHSPLDEAEAELRPILRDRRQRFLRRVADLVLPPEVRELVASHPRLTLVGLDLLGELPFEALPLERGPLGVVAAVDYLPSLPLGLLLKERAARDRGEDGTVLLLVGEGFGGDEGMLAAYDEDRVRVARGVNATLTTLRKELPRACVLQLFVHGSRDAAREEPMVLALAADDLSPTGEIGASELRTLDAPPLVLLTACGSAREALRRGDAAAASLAGALFHAHSRTRCVLVTPVDLDVVVARELSRDFHAALVEGVSPAEALRRARARLAADERFADPFHLLVRVVGLGQSPWLGGD